MMNCFCFVNDSVAVAHWHPLGLRYDKAADIEGLRYGRVMLMTDQDHDGSHIKGLFINLIHSFWPNLLRQGSFLEEFVTPIVKVRRKSSRGKDREALEFFTMPEYAQFWRMLSFFHQYVLKRLSECESGMRPGSLRQA